MKTDETISPLYIKTSLILFVAIIINGVLLNFNYLIPSLVGLMIAFLSYIINLKGSFYFSRNLKNTFVFFIIISFFLRIIIIASVAIYFVLKQPTSIIPYIIGYSLNQVSIIFATIKKKGA